jgi:hypothetical protein
MDSKDFPGRIAVVNPFDGSEVGSVADMPLDATQVLEAGGVMIIDSSDYRFDAMPFGGFKYGSLGREEVRFAYEEMTQPQGRVHSAFDKQTTP